MKTKEVWAVALDFTKMDSSILSYTRFLSTIFQPKKIHFINVIKEVETSTYLSGEFLGYSNLLVIDQKLMLEHRVSEHFKGSSVPFECHVNSGAPFDEVINLVLNKKVDLVITGRKKTLKGLGIVSDRLSRNLPCNFLLVPEDFEPKLNKVSVVTDFSEHSTLALQQAVEICKTKENTNIIVHHSYVVPMGYSKSGKSFEEIADIMKSNSEKQMTHWLKEIQCTADSVLTLNKDDSLESQILNVVNENNVDLIVIGSKGQTKASLAMLGSNTMKLLKSNDVVPLLIVKIPGENLDLLEALKRI